MALGKKYTCYVCSTKFYDLGKPEPICPKCGADQRENPSPDPQQVILAKYKKPAPHPPPQPRVVRKEEESPEDLPDFSEDLLDDSDLSFDDDEFDSSDDEPGAEEEDYE